MAIPILKLVPPIVEISSLGTKNEDLGKKKIYELRAQLARLQASDDHFP